MGYYKDSKWQYEANEIAAGDYHYEKESSRSPTGYVAPVTREEYEDLKSKVDSLYDTLKNGIEYNETQNIYVLVWTEKEIKDAREEAKKLAQELGWQEPSAT